MNYYHVLKMVCSVAYKTLQPHTSNTSYNTNKLCTIVQPQWLTWYVAFRAISRQVAQLSQRDRAAVWVSCGANINVVFCMQRTLL